MLTVVPRAWFSWDFSVREGGRELAFIDRHWFRERATFVLDGEDYVVRRTSVRSGSFVLERAGVPIAHALKPSAFRREVRVSVGTDHYELRPTSLFGREFRLFLGRTPVGAIRPVAAFRRTAEANLPPRLPRAVQFFIIFLVLTIWKRASDAAAASG